jgi:hypothetical protein
MRVSVEVRSSGPGPRVTFSGRSADPGWVCSATRRMGAAWKRMGYDYRGRYRLLADGVGIIIRRDP